ncbi:hypothetical protein [Streptomyces griseorubiginosus]|uniref:hypothetical protein n=1 Tax=Streptomyces griseorubiginosus TaxID=67304 RepID=UPI001AD66485|nr:hypothetical protein [Streptomyces griseorubiginosus]MBO4259642.1 hypothetical protein [Streptomyces griseorubiginosus]
MTLPATPVYCRGTWVAMSTEWWDGSPPTTVWPAGRGAAAVVGGRYGGAASRPFFAVIPEHWRRSGFNSGLS